MAPGHSRANIALFGGGRWARVLLQVVLKEIGSEALVTVHTANAADAMQRWVDENGLSKRVLVASEGPDFVSRNYQAAIIANSVKDHKTSAMGAISAGVPVLIEKPMAKTAADTIALIDSANNNNVLLMPAFVFNHATYIDNFMAQVGCTRALTDLRFQWSDKLSESRYGEKKSFDAAAPVFLDVLPHVLSILSKILKNNYFQYQSCSVSDGGSSVEISVFVSGVRCIIVLQRNSSERIRRVQISEGEKEYELDFSCEPGSIQINEISASGDPNWNSSPSPLTRVVKSFLSAVENKNLSSKSDTSLALAISKVIDELSVDYFRLLDLWLVEHMERDQINNDAVVYFLSELICGDAGYSRFESVDIIEKYLSLFCSGDLVRVLDEKDMKLSRRNILNHILSEESVSCH